MMNKAEKVGVGILVSMIVVIGIIFAMAFTGNPLPLSAFGEEDSVEVNLVGSSWDESEIVGITGHASVKEVLSHIDGVSISYDGGRVIGIDDDVESRSMAWRAYRNGEEMAGGYTDTILVDGDVLLLDYSSMMI